MKYGENTVAIYYRIKNIDKSLKFKITPIMNFRDFHSDNHNHEFRITQKKITNTKIEVIIDDNFLSPIYINLSDGKFYKNITTFYDMYYRKEEERGFIASENHIIPGTYEIELNPNEEKEITFSCSLNENIDNIDGINLINEEIARQTSLVADSMLIKEGLSKKEEELRVTLVKAADNFVVDRPRFNLHTIIAGYPWFLDWGRDSMIAFEGVLLKTKRFDIAKEVLLTFIRDIKDGLVPNGYSGYDNRPLYNSADSSLLLFQEIEKYLEYTNDLEFIKNNLYEKLKEIIKAYSTRIDKDGNNIYMDEDYLISGEQKKHK